MRVSHGVGLHTVSKGLFPCEVAPNVAKLEGGEPPTAAPHGRFANQRLQLKGKTTPPAMAKPFGKGCDIYKIKKGAFQVPQAVQYASTDKRITA